MLDELIFVVGPLIATVLATQVEPVLVLYLGVALVLAGALWLAALRDSEPPAARARRARGMRSALRERGMPLLILFAVAMGAIFASAEVTMVAFCGQHGHRGLSGARARGDRRSAAGSSGLLYGSRAWRTDVLRPVPAAGARLRRAAVRVPRGGERAGARRAARSSSGWASRPR